MKGNKKIAAEEIEVLFRAKPVRRIMYLPFAPYLAIYNMGAKFHQKQIPLDSLGLKKTEMKYKHLIEALQTQRMLKFQQVYYESHNVNVHPDSLTQFKWGHKKLARLEKKRDGKIGKYHRRFEEGNLLMRSFGEAPSIFELQKITATQDQIKELYKVNGFFRTSVQVKLDTTAKKRVSASYLIKEREASLVKSILYNIPDSIMKAVYDANNKEPFFKEGDRYNEAKMSAERERIYTLMKNNGYFRFDRDYIYFEIDSNRADFTFDITLNIALPPGQENHKRYVFKQVFFNITDNLNTKPDTTLALNGVQYVEIPNRFSKKTLDGKVLFKTGKFYSQTDLFDTQKMLGALDMFRFVNINFDTTAKGDLVSNIFAKPQKKYQLVDEWGVSFNQTGIPGPSALATFKNRNLLGVCDIFEINGRFAFESGSVSTVSRRLNSLQHNINVALLFPEIVFPGKGVFKEKIRQWNAQTKLQTGYNFVKRPEYSRLSVNATGSYSWNIHNKKYFKVAISDFNVVKSDPEANFSRHLDSLFTAGNNLKLTFANSLVISTWASVSFIKTGTSKKKPSRYISLMGESGGASLNLLGKQTLGKSDSLFGLRYYRYLSSSVDMRFTRPLLAGVQLAFRVRGGFSLPYGSGQKKILPYEKYFFAGGGSGLRAWQPRRLGPGGYSVKDAAGRPIYTFEQYGELLFESSLELRRKLFGYLEGAVFFDAGNIWMLNPDDRQGSAISRDFYKEIALGTGIGLRFDFSFMIIRFDLGLKMLDPAMPEGQKWVFNQVNFKNVFFGGNRYSSFNFGIGYPF